MEKIDIRYWLQIGADLGILVGLLFVGLQLYQDRELVTAELSAASFQEHHDRNIALLGSDPADTLSKLASGRALDEKEQFVARAYFASRFANWNRNSILERNGLLPASWRSGTLLDDRLWANPYGIEAIENYLESSPFLTAEFKSKLSAELDLVKVTHSSRQSLKSAN